jgi:tRNA(fMet)-specific endonuclease VapC
VSGEFLLDTNVVVPFQAGEVAVVDRLAREIVYLPAPVVGELFYGAYHSVRQMENLSAVEDLCVRITVLSCDYGTGRFFGVIKTSLRARGLMIPDNDIWIAALARQHNLTLATRDAHFSGVNDLHVGKW